jgi:hypothetical protein
MAKPAEAASADYAGALAGRIRKEQASIDKVKDGMR